MGVGDKTRLSLINELWLLVNKIPAMTGIAELTDCKTGRTIPGWHTGKKVYLQLYPANGTQSQEQKPA